ncbi:hypothetical protein JQS43_02705 [Natronosporangium hydrolyticum]|uniref:EfeO-type cupredoxin-like domain-containing protein n=1 Tax=Natronosporangium hydrolyticum TaxID=2811111 RepID=A0A895YGS3_9ACTN|nr:cupredoxin domain-containing protein [Natronosporangium hydrolyticum]QSB15292.1 hypothetical protein JQS43_02705 [Natronosporangium hydrolyticum]
MSRVLRRAGGALAAAAVAFAAGACTADDADDSTTPAQEEPVAPVEPVDPPETDDVPAADEEAAEVPVILVDDEVLLPATIFPAGTYTFVVEQEGQEPHLLSIEGPGVSSSTSEVAPGASPEQLTVTLEPGTYELWSSVDGDRGESAEVVIEVE